MRLIKTLFIDSEYRDVNETNSKFKVHLDDEIYCDGFFIKHLSFPNTLYSFQLTRNKFYFYLQGSAVIQSVTISTSKVYDATTFVTDFQTLLQAVNVNFLVTFSTSTGKLTISNPVTNFKIATKSSDPTITNSALIKIGFHENHSFNFVASIEAEHILKLYPTRYVYLTCNIANDISEHNGGLINNIIARVPLINSSFGSYLTYETSSFASDFISINHSFIEELQIYFVNDFAEIIDSTNGCESSIEIHFYEN
jgi:hypothetical protein